MEALARLELASPMGPVRLDDRRQAVAPNYLSRVDLAANGKPTTRVVRTLENVELTFNGDFTPATAPPSHASPACRRADPLAWSSAG
jgi:hypothetical protein